MIARSLTRSEDEDGFTLIELMVVVLIIGILIAIALPTFLGARSRAQDRAAQSDLRNALVAAKTMYTDGSSFATASSAAGGLVSVEPSLCYVATGTLAVSTGATCVTGSGSASLSVSAATTLWGAARLSASGTCFTIKDTSTSGTRYASTTAANCSGTWATTGTNTNLSNW